MLSKILPSMFYKNDKSKSTTDLGSFFLLDCFLGPTVGISFMDHSHNEEPFFNQLYKIKLSALSRNIFVET